MAVMQFHFKTDENHLILLTVFSSLLLTKQLLKPYIKKCFNVWKEKINNLDKNM
ncbi:MAG: hypothetical protein QRY72_04200 [Candidatus Rhabdochlamydia sp.]